MRLFFYILVFGLFSCSKSPDIESGEHSYQSSNQSLCVPQILDIEVISVKHYLGLDEAYDYFLENSDNQQVRECLVSNITNDTKVRDPFKFPGPRSNVTIGDISYNLLSKVYGLNLQEHLPEDIKVSYDKIGIYSYYHYVNTVENGRQVIKDNVIEHYNEVNEF